MVKVNITGLIKIFILLSLAFLLGIFPQVLVILITASIFRLLSGGVHCTTYLRCLFFGLLLFLAIGKMAQILSFIKLPAIVSILVFITLTSIFISYKWAPAETENKPLSDDEKPRLKKFTILWIITWSILVNISLVIFSLSGSLIMASMLAHITQALSLTPVGYRIIGHLDKLLGNIFRERREANV